RSGVSGFACFSGWRGRLAPTVSMTTAMAPRSSVRARQSSREWPTGQSDAFVRTPAPQARLSRVSSPEECAMVRPALIPLALLALAGAAHAAPAERLDEPSVR